MELILAVLGILNPVLLDTLLTIAFGALAIITPYLLSLNSAYKGVYNFHSGALIPKNHQTVLNKSMQTHPTPHLLRFRN